MRLLLVSLFLACVCWAQELHLKSNVPLVQISAGVTTAKGKPLNGLSAQDFEVLDNGKPISARVDITDDAGLAPVALVAVVQTSDISLSALKKIQKVGAMIPEAVVGESGQAAVVTFNDDVHVAQGFTHDADAITQAFRALKPADNMGGRMVDAVNVALNLIEKLPSPARASILIISETRDRGSKEKLKDLLARLQRTGVTVYGLSYSAYATAFTTKASDYEPPDEGGLFLALTETMRLAKGRTVLALANETGGRQVRFETKSKLENDLIELGTDIHSRYLISFTPPESEQPAYHKLTIRVKNQPDAVVRARPGYWTGLNTTK